MKNFDRRFQKECRNIRRSQEIFWVFSLSKTFCSFIVYFERVWSNSWENLKSTNNFEKHFQVDCFWKLPGWFFQLLFDVQAFTSCSVVFQLNEAVGLLFVWKQSKLSIFSTVLTTCWASLVTNTLSKLLSKVSFKSRELFSPSFSWKHFCQLLDSSSLKSSHC
jgi:hypothetical protein